LDERVKLFALYTAARAGLFLVAYGLIWLVFGRWLDWTALSALYTALLAMLISAAASLVLLRPLRSRLSEQVAARAERVKHAYEARRSAEDDD
jgi:membrane protein implicated in regulation of membrane protease activity